MGGEKRVTVNILSRRLLGTGRSGRTSRQGWTDVEAVMKIVFLSNVEGSHGVSLKVSQRDPSTALEMTKIR
jgi:hypothetical protein